MKKGIVMMTVVAACTSAMAGTSYWKGGSGNWSDPANWNPGLPAVGDTAVLTNTTADAILISNDLENVSIGSLSLPANASGKAVTLVGGKISLAADKSLTLRGGAKVYTDLEILGNLTVYGAGNSSLYGKLTAVGTSGTLTQNIDNGGTVYLRGQVDIKGLSGSWQWGYLRFGAAGNRLGAFKPWYGGVYFDCDGAMDPDMAIDWGTTYYEVNRGVYYLGSTHQVANRIGGPQNAKGLQIDGTGTLVLHGTQSAETWCLIQSSESIVWDPVSSDCTQTFTNRAHTTTGSITVSNGTVRVAAGGSFKKLTKLTVAEGATFVLDTEVSGALGGLQTVLLDGTLDVTDRCDLPFAEIPTMRLGPKGKLVLPENVNLTVTRLDIGGLFPASDTYVEGCGWIEGRGSVKVVNAGLTSWKAPTSGMWLTGSCWADGEVPTDERDAYLTVRGANYSVSADGASIKSKTIMVGTSCGDTATLAFGARNVLDNSFVDVVRGGRFLVGDGANLLYSTPQRIVEKNSNSSTTAPALRIGDGGLFEQTGGYMLITNKAGFIGAQAGGIWRIGGGTNRLFVGNNGCLYFEPSSRLEITNGLMQLTNFQQGYNSRILMRNATVDVCQTGQFLITDQSGESANFGSGLVRVRDNASFKISDRFTYRPSTAGEEARLSVEDDSAFTIGDTFMFARNVAGTRTIVDIRSSKTATFGLAAYIGYEKGCGELNVYTGSTVAVSSYGLRIGIKETADAASPTGVVNLVGGKLTCEGGAENWGGRGGSWDGTSVGDGRLASETPVMDGDICRKTICGTVRITDGGCYEQTTGQFGIGLGRTGSGEITVDGSCLSNRSTKASSVGAFGGEGLLRLRNGAAVDFAGNLWVGGVSTNVLGKYFAKMVDGDSTTASGTVDAESGTLRVRVTLVLGARGTGTLRIGGGATVAAKNVVLSNHVASVLAFTAGALSVGKLTAEKLTVAPGAKLVVDASACDFDHIRSQTLVETDAWEGDFDVADVMVVPADKYAVRRKGNLLRIVPLRGSVLVVR